MSAVVEQALALWGLSGARYALVAARENAVYRVTANGVSHALRLHRKGYRSDQELWSELELMSAVARGGIQVPDPIPSTSGQMLHVIDGIQVDMLTWLQGGTVAEALARATGAERVAIFRQVGCRMARMHDVTDAWPLPEGFTRCAWDRAGLLGDAPLWDRFWANPALDDKDRALFLAFRDRANTVLEQSQDSLDYGLIHADLVSLNMMVDEGQVRFIDFDDSGFGFRIFDIATALLKHSSEPDYTALQSALLDGYASVRPLDLAALDLFLAIRAATYVGWNITRLTEDGAAARNNRFICEARSLARNYLSRSQQP